MGNTKHPKTFPWVWNQITTERLSFAVAVASQLWKTRKRESPGRPDKHEVIRRETMREAIERRLKEEGEKYAARYFSMAKADPPTMRHLVDKAMPPKTDQHTSIREAAESLTRALMAREPRLVKS
jgi:hypothetical protein